MLICLDIRNNGGIDLRDQQHNFMEVQAEAHRQGSLSLLLFASIQFLTTLIAPYLVRDSKCDRLHPTTKLRLINRFFSNHFRDQWISLRTLWICSHSIFAICMFSTIFVTRTETAIVLIGITGISMALTQFVPFALLGIILSRHEKDIESEGLIEKGKSTPYGQNSGIVMGLHNVVIAAPQVIAALTSSAMFRILGGIRSKNGLTAAGEDIKSIGLVLSTGGITALLAIYMTLKVREETIVGPVFVLTEMEEDDEDEEAEEKSYRSLSTSYMASIGREASLDDLSTGMDL